VLKKNQLKVEALIEKKYYSLNSSASFKEAHELFEESTLNELPVVDDSVFKGVLFKDMISGREGNKDLIASIEDQLRVIAVNEEERIIVALKKMTLEGVTTLAVIDDDGLMKGMLLASDLWNEFAIKSSLAGMGGWVVLSMKKTDFKLSEISQIVESNGMMIVMHFIHFFQELDIIDVHIKVNRENVNELVQTFQRYGYKVVDVIQPKKFVDDWDNRFDELMRFFST
jgi:CBS domain-containing protein